MSGAKRPRKDLASLLMEFNKKYGSPKKPYIAVVEGKDEPYYRPRVASNIIGGKALEFLDGDGRSNVVELSNCVMADEETYDEPRHFFFVDRDYSLPSTEYKDYVTPRYSVENFYTCEETFANVVRIGFKLDENSDEYKEICELYKKWFLELSEELREFNTWLVYQITEAKDTDGKPPSLNLNGTNLSKIIDIKFDGKNIVLNAKFRLDSYLDIFPGAFPSDAESMKSIKNKLGDTDPFLYFRGKFALEFMALVLNYLRQDGKKDKPNLFSMKRNFNLPFSGNLISEYSGYAETPACLVQYLRDRTQAVA